MVGYGRSGWGRVRQVIAKLGEVRTQKGSVVLFVCLVNSYSPRRRGGPPYA